MKTVLDSAHTWFFETVSHAARNDLVINLVEGIKSSKPEFIEISEGVRIGPHFPVEILAESRCASVCFSGVLAYQIVRESYSAPQSEVVGDKGVLQQCTQLTYLTYLISDSLIEQLEEGKYKAFFIWTEDQTIFVVCTETVSVTIEDRLPNFSLERGKSYCAC
jgi:hypothetical protein